MGLCRINMEYSFAVGGVCARACVCVHAGEKGVGVGGMVRWIER